MCVCVCFVFGSGVGVLFRPLLLPKLVTSNHPFCAEVGVLS